VVYCGKNEDYEEVAHVAREEARLAHKVVLDLAAHVISMDNFFTSVGFFEELASMQIYATGTFRSNRIGLPLVLKNTWAFWIGGCMRHGRRHVFYEKIRSRSDFFPHIHFSLDFLAYRCL
jgi:hypothetical protein